MSTHNYQILNHELATKVQQCKIDIAQKNQHINHIQFELMDHKIKMRSLHACIMNCVQNIGTHLQQLIDLKHFQCTSYDNTTENEENNFSNKNMPSDRRNSAQTFNSSRNSRNKLGIIDSLQNDLSTILELSDITASLSRSFSTNGK